MTWALETVTVLDGQTTPQTYPAAVYRESSSSMRATAVRELPGDIDTIFWNYAATPSGIVNTNAPVTIKSAAGSGLRNYVSGIQIDAEALTTATEFVIRDGSGGTVLWRTKIGTGGLTGGRNIVFPNPLKGSTNTLLEIATLTASGAGAVYFNAQGFVAA